MKVILVNLGDQPVRVEPGMRIAQLVVAPIVRAQLELVSELDVTERGAGGFGSTGLAAREGPDGEERGSAS